jgi:tetratricopeptide (TPR) repeat protein
MSFWRKLFGGGTSLAQMRLALEQKRWADAVNIGTDLEQVGGTPDERMELSELLVVAGDGLAELNLSEGEACLRAGEMTRANEHFSLAASQARSTDMRQRVLQATTELQRDAGTVKPLQPTSPDSCHTGCISSCGVAGKEPGEAISGMELDTQTRIELILASYPDDLAERYMQRSGSFCKAFLLAHEGRADAALAAFEELPEEERDDLFYFERGALRGRIGETRLACSDLEKALEINPAHFLAVETLVHLEMSANNGIPAEARLKRMLSHNIVPAFCHANLAQILFRRGDMQGSLEHGLQALNGGDTSAETLLLTASLLEQKGQIDAAERVLLRLPGGGCAGGANLPLAEFWLRCGKNHDKVLEAFKAALRSEPDNSRWLIRVAQVYLARGWKKDAISLLEKVLSAGNLEPGLRVEASAHLDSAKNSEPIEST